MAEVEVGAVDGLEAPVLAAEQHKDDVVVVVILLGDDGDKIQPPRACPASSAGAVPATVSSPIWPQGPRSAH
uniref:Uncharacterized protein n=1 Tax=Oryza meridionalis TaxID=40149 RepID=A0A0E0ED29_9ORYZ